MNTIQIVIQQGKTWSFEELGNGSIALDGAVAGPRLDPERHRYSFDHHAGCLRLMTSATCRQVYDAVLLGLDPSGMTIYLNDLDGDTILATWILLHHRAMLEGDARRRLAPLLDAVAALDAHGPAYPVPSPAHSWHYYRRVIEPATVQKRAGYPDGPRPALDQALEALDGWWEAGLPCTEEAAPPDRYPALVTHHTWILADGGAVSDPGRCAGPLWLYEQGFDRLVLVFRNRDGTYRYTIGKRSDLVSGFPLRAIYAALNKREKEVREGPLNETWGGGSSIGGSPRDGSRLLPDEVAEVIDALLSAAESEES